MGRLALAAFVAAVLAYSVGCANRALDDGSDGGATDCTALNETQCMANAQCRADYCAGCSCKASFVACVPVDANVTPCSQPPCPLFTCDCHGLDETSCIA